MNTQVFLAILAFLVGGGLSAFYFGGLWVTVRSLPDAKRPVLVSLASFFIRTAVVILGFYLIMGGPWERLLIALVGFVIMREILVRRLGKKKQLVGAPRTET
jgi:F1F0 ATPase subunit 2